jgi:hypothetical protein
MQSHVVAKIPRNCEGKIVTNCIINFSTYTTFLPDSASKTLQFAAIDKMCLILYVCILHYIAVERTKKGEANRE